MARNNTQEFTFTIVEIHKDVPTGNAGEIIRVATINFGAGPKLDIRRWFKPSPEKASSYTLDNNGFAMGKGISINEDNLSEVAKAVFDGSLKHENGLYA